MEEGVRENVAAEIAEKAKYRAAYNKARFNISRRLVPRGAAP